MGERVKASYLAALELLNVSEFARDTSRAARTVRAYQSGSRRITDDAARELVGYLRRHSLEFQAAADALQAAIEQEGEDGTK